MQTLWSRVALNTRCNCRCPSCLHATRTGGHALGRRGATAARAGGRFLSRPVQSATFAYSAIFATAAVFDAKRKKRRSELWDLAIEKAKEGDILGAQETLREAGLIEQTSGGQLPEDRPQNQEPTLEHSSLQIAEEGNQPSPHQALDQKAEMESSESQSNIRSTESWNQDLSQSIREYLTEVPEAQTDSDPSSDSPLADDPLSDDALSDDLQKSPWETLHSNDEILVSDWRKVYFSKPEMPATLDQLPPSPVRLNRNFVPPESLWAASHLREAAMENRHTPKKMRVLELAVPKLVIQMMLSVKETSLKAAATKTVTEVFEFPELLRPLAFASKASLCASLNALNLEIRQIRYGDTSKPPRSTGLESLVPIPIPTYEQDYHGLFRDITRNQNKLIISMLGDFRQGRTSKVSQKHIVRLAGISNVLLTSTAPPNLETVNILLDHLGWARSTTAGAELLDHVIEFLFETRIRPNEFTCAAILDHYVAVSDRHRFSRFIALMRGYAVGGLTLARPTLDVRAINGDFLVRKAGQSHKIVQQVQPTPLVYNSLLRGLLKFAGLQRTVELSHEFRQEGWTYDYHSFTFLLRQCIDEQNWELGRACWTQMSKSIRSWHPQVLWQRTVWADLMCLCQACSRPKELRDYLREAVLHGFDEYELSCEFNRREKHHAKRLSSGPTMSLEEIQKRRDKAFDLFEKEMIGYMRRKRYVPMRTADGELAPSGLDEWRDDAERARVYGALYKNPRKAEEQKLRKLEEQNLRKPEKMAGGVGHMALKGRH
ncbi:hypothetical protein K402DRAFT_397061 [Aulographum hederae CBS 113979]|uniref:Uncharacterized protein n=1 Tax=Aulographum hederae CBS 113979 TaxID=1176131 RepID=A0A6G1GQ95_9PEZI|nr:hypothetical protein K402DRAFT_397061 [Aulographum hederae CBS 113979]